MPFVQPLPRDEQQILLQALLHRIQGKHDAALTDYQQALDLNPGSLLAYVSRGTTYAEQENYGQALADYNSAIRIDRNFASAYLGRGIIYAKQGRYREAQRENDRAIHLGLKTDTAFIN